MSDLDNTHTLQSVTTATLTDDGGAVADGKKWYIAIVQTNCEKKVQQNLEANDIETFVPMQKTTSIRAGKRHTTERVVIRSRVFVRTLPDSASRTQVKQMLYVKKFVTYPGSCQDAVVPDSQMQMFKYMVHCSDEGVNPIDSDIKPGRKVRVARGKFKGLEGNICEMISKKHTCVGVRMDILGYACVHIDATDLEFID